MLVIHESIRLTSIVGKSIKVLKEPESRGELVLRIPCVFQYGSLTEEKSRTSHKAILGRVLAPRVTGRVLQQCYVFCDVSICRFRDLWASKIISLQSTKLSNNFLPSVLAALQNIAVEALTFGSVSSALATQDTQTRMTLQWFGDAASNIDGRWLLEAQAFTMVTQGDEGYWVEGEKGFADYSCKCLSLVDLKDTRRFIMQHFLSDITQVDANHCVYTREEENAIVVENEDLEFGLMLRFEYVTGAEKVWNKLHQFFVEQSGDTISDEHEEFVENDDASFSANFLRDDEQSLNDSMDSMMYDSDDEPSEQERIESLDALSALLREPLPSYFPDASYSPMAPLVTPLSQVEAKRHKDRSAQMSGLELQAFAQTQLKRATEAEAQVETLNSKLRESLKQQLRYESSIEELEDRLQIRQKEEERINRQILQELSVLENELDMKDALLASKDVMLKDARTREQNQLEEIRKLSLKLAQLQGPKSVTTSGQKRRQTNENADVSNIISKDMNNLNALPLVPQVIKVC